MRIGFVAQPTDVVPSVHGASIALWIDATATRLAEQHSVTVYSRRTDHYVDSDERDGVRHVRVSTGRDERIIAYLRRLERLLRRVFRRKIDLFFSYYYFSRVYYWYYVRRICDLAVADNLDVLVVSNYSQFVPSLKRRCSRMKLALMMQCDWLIELPRCTAARRARDADAIMGCSDYIANGVRRRLPALASRCHTLYNGSSTQALRRDENVDVSHEDFTVAACDKAILFVGRLTPEKGVHVLAEAMKSVLKRYPRCVLLIAGGFHLNPPGPRGDRAADKAARKYERLKDDYEPYLRMLLEPLGDRVRFLGHVPHHRLEALYRRCDIFVHPSLWNEPFGMILTEAMVCARPVISTYTGGIPEIVVHGETGLLVPPDDSAALADGIVELLADDRRRREMGEAGRRRVEGRFTWDRTAHCLERILEGVLNGEGAVSTPG